MSSLHHSAALFHAVLHESLAQVAGLLLSNERAPVVISQDFPRELQVRLSQHGIEPVDGNIEPVVGPIERMAREMGIPVFDILGRYFPEDKKIELYPKVIFCFSKSLGIDEGVLTEIVLAHEIAHAVTHFALDENEAIWEQFNKATTEDAELLAQLLPFILFRQLGMSDHIHAMIKLGENQGDKYNRYLDYVEDSLSFVRQLVRQLRLRVVSS